MGGLKLGGEGGARRATAARVRAGGIRADRDQRARVQAAREGTPARTHAHTHTRTHAAHAHGTAGGGRAATTGAGRRQKRQPSQPAAAAAAAAGGGFWRGGGRRAPTATPNPKQRQARMHGTARRLQRRRLRVTWRPGLKRRRAAERASGRVGRQVGGCAWAAAGVCGHACAPVSSSAEGDEEEGRKGRGTGRRTGTGTDGEGHPRAGGVVTRGREPRGLHARSRGAPRIAGPGDPFFFFSLFFLSFFLLSFFSREKSAERVCVCVCACMYIYIYTTPHTALGRRAGGRPASARQQTQTRRADERGGGAVVAVRGPPCACGLGGPGVPARDASNGQRPAAAIACAAPSDSPTGPPAAGQPAPRPPARDAGAGAGWGRGCAVTHPGAVASRKPHVRTS